MRRDNQRPHAASHSGRSVLYNSAVVSDKLHACAAAEHVYYIRGVSVGRVVDPTHLVGDGVFWCESTVFVGEYAFDDAAGSVALPPHRETPEQPLCFSQRDLAALGQAQLSACRGAAYGAIRRPRI